MTSIAILGGGFSGTATAIHLLRQARGSLRITLVNQVYPLAQGAAYSTRRPEHVLNVPVRGMSALADQPDHFYQWLRQRADYQQVDEVELRERFVPRRDYGLYLTELLASTRQGMPPGVAFEPITDEAVDLIPGRTGATVVLRGGGSFQADQILLATGNRKPMTFPLENPGFHHPCYIENPWLPWEQHLPAPTDDILMVGAGLTMVDACLTLLELGWKGKLISLSRSAQPPLSHFPLVEYKCELPTDGARRSLADWVAIVDAECQRAQVAGVPTSVVVDQLRPQTQAIWRQFSPADKLEFKSRYRQRWGAARHRIPAEVHARLSQAIAAGQLQIRKGTIRRLEADGTGLRAHTTGLGGAGEVLSVGLVLNCTGPEESCSQATAPLLCSLRQRGLVQPDEVDLGLRVTDDFRVVASSGQPVPWLYAIGPLLRGTLWETVAVPEIREQAASIARTMLASE